MSSWPQILPQTLWVSLPRGCFLARNAGVALRTSLSRDLPACRWQLWHSPGESCCLREWIWEIQTFPVEIPPHLS